jgi:hypothetical protein
MIGALLVLSTVVLFGTDSIADPAVESPGCEVGSAGQPHRQGSVSSTG